MENNKLVQNWFKDFIKALRFLSSKMEGNSDVFGNEDYSVIGTSEASKQLIKELCDEIDEEYSLRSEVEHETNLDEWLEKKTEETLEELINADIIDVPSEDDIEKCHKTIRESIAKGIAEEARQAALELSSDTDALVLDEANVFKVNGED